jgi:hypothetical protein
MGLFRLLFMKKKCRVYTAFGNEQYFSAASKFSERGISYDVVRKSETNAFGMAFGESNRMSTPFIGKGQIDNAQYDFYVKKEDEHLARGALRH